MVSPSASHIPAFYNDLDATLAMAWAQLARGVADRRAAFHTPTLGTIALDGSPSVRTVILRGCNIAARSLRFHTDRRSIKVTEIERDPRVSLHFYDAGQKIQLRLAGIVDVHSGDLVAETAWVKAQPMSRAIYGMTLPPGTVIENPVTSPPPIVPDGQTVGFENFVIADVVVTAIEWLYLGHQGHRRARFDWPEGQLQAAWLAP